MAQPLRTLYRAINPANVGTSITRISKPWGPLRQPQPRLLKLFRSFTSSINNYSAQTFTTKPPPGSKMRAYWYDNVEVRLPHTHSQLHDLERRARLQLDFSGVEGTKIREQELML